MADGSAVDKRLADKFRDAFKSAFGLSDSHYETTQDPACGGSVFWRVYWDQDAIDVAALDKCEHALNDVAEGNGVRVIVLETTAIPRSKTTIAELIKYNGTPVKKGVKLEDMPPEQQEQVKAAVAQAYGAAYKKWFAGTAQVLLAQTLGIEMSPALEEAIAQGAGVADKGAQPVGSYPWGEEALSAADILSDTLLISIDKVETPDPSLISGGEVKQYTSVLRPVQLFTKKNKNGKYTIHDGKHRLMAWKSAGYTAVPVVFVKMPPKK